MYNKKTAAYKAPEIYGEVVSGARDVVLVPLLMSLTLSEAQSADRGSLRGRSPFNEVLTENR